MKTRGVRIILWIVWLLLGAGLLAIVGYGAYHFVVGDMGPVFELFERTIVAVIVLVVVVLFLSVLVQRLSERKINTHPRNREAIDIVVVTTPRIEGLRGGRTIGPVRGNTVLAVHLGKDVMARLRSVVGGEVREYEKLLVDSRERAFHRMIVQAEQRGANAVLNVRFSTSIVLRGAAEAFVYGTAVVVEQDKP